MGAACIALEEGWEEKDWGVGFFDVSRKIDLAQVDDHPNPYRA